MTGVTGDRTAIGEGGAGLRQLDALGPNGSYHTQHRFMVRDVAGVPVAELSLLPKLYVTRAMSALHRATTRPAGDRITALAKAAELFAHGTVAGLPVAEYEYLVSRVSGMPISVVRAASAITAEAARHADASAHQGRPRGAAADWRATPARNGHGVWTRRGDVLAVHAAGNHPGVHGLWLEALALGYRVALRPSRREPFTPHRLIGALREAGFGADQAVLLPTDYDVADEMLRGADLGLAYGGDDVMAKYAHDPAVLPQGPGRSKILVTADQDWREHLDTIVDSISLQGGTTCINATAVLVEGDPAPLAEAIASRLSAMPSLPPQDDRAVLPVQPVEEARRFEKFLLDKASDARPWLGADGIVGELGDGSAALRPAVHQVDRSDAPQVKVELPFPCVWVAPWRPEEGVAPLRDSLVVTAMTGKTALVDELIGEATISNVYVGDHPTCWFASGIPHDDYLSSFLMRAKAVIRD
jgi:acyl-CoA reductase-like NAD-dependent aldehyde dehydrogenase